MSPMWMLGVAFAQEPVEEDVSEEVPEDERERIFMPAFEMGLTWSEDPDVGLGITFRTSVEWRLRRISAPFVRLSYDAANAPFTQRNVGGLTSLTSSLATHDIHVGGGIRFGPRAVQIVPSLQGGIQIAEIPELLEDGDGFVLEPRTQFYGLVVGGLGLEWYFDDNAAFTIEASGRARLGDGERIFAGGGTIGVTTAF